MKWFDYKYEAVYNAAVFQAHELVGRLDYGFMLVKVSPRLGDPVLWAHLMSVGGTFFGSGYIVVKAGSLDDLALKVTEMLEDKCLHGVPFQIAENVFCQVLVVWDQTVSKARRRQLFGCLLALKYKTNEGGPAEEVNPASPKDDAEGKNEDEGEGEGGEEGEGKGKGDGDGKNGEEVKGGEEEEEDEIKWDEE